MKLITLALVALLPGTAAAQGPISVADALFAQHDARLLPPADRTEIAALLPMSLQAGEIVSNIPGCAGKPMRASVAIADMNLDGVPEILVHAGNACTSGMTGASVWLFGKGLDGRWREYLNAAAADFAVLESRVQGWNELALAGRSECVGVWQHRSDRFVFSRTVTPEGRPCTP
ncbi:MAG: hypothetical protein KDH15_06610 [Rhodocyclaceae bacterium]|nr:hypothetical protein [Rhodocyclaceae bacterium]